MAQLVSGSDIFPFFHRALRASLASEKKVSRLLHGRYQHWLAVGPPLTSQNASLRVMKTNLVFMTLSGRQERAKKTLLGLHGSPASVWQQRWAMKTLLGLHGPLMSMKWPQAQPQRSPPYSTRERSGRVGRCQKGRVGTQNAKPNATNLGPNAINVTLV